MKFVELHLVKNNKKFAVNPHTISAITATVDGNTRIYYTDLSQHDDVIEAYEVVITKVEKACRTSNPPKYLDLKLAEFITAIIDEDTMFNFNNESDFVITFEGMLKDES